VGVPGWWPVSHLVGHVDRYAVLAGVPGALVMTGRIPPYGEHLRREPRSYHPEMSSTVYVSKRDPAWFVWSDKTSHRWWVFYRVQPEGSPEVVVCVSRTQRTLELTMNLLVDGFQGGFYLTPAPAEPVDVKEPCIHPGVFARGPVPGSEHCWRCDTDVPREEL